MFPAQPLSPLISDPGLLLESSFFVCMTRLSHMDVSVLSLGSPAPFLITQGKHLQRSSELAPTVSPWAVGVRVTSLRAKWWSDLALQGASSPARLRWPLWGTRTSWSLNSSSAALMSMDTWPSTQSWRVACRISHSAPRCTSSPTRSCTTTPARVSPAPYPRGRGSAWQGSGGGGWGRGGGVAGPRVPLGRGCGRGGAVPHPTGSDSGCSPELMPPPGLQGGKFR